MRRTKLTPCLLVLFASQFINQGADRSPAPPRTHTPAERMTTARLKATHEAVEQLKQGRRAMPPTPGLHDYRAILHAHAEDSAHTGGSRPEMLADAKKAGVSAILLTDHFRPPRDFITESWRGLHEGVLFIPGSEARGFLVHPVESILNRMDLGTPEFVKAVTADDGLIFLSHIEERPGHSTEGLTGLEVYNRHADAKDDMATLIMLALKLTDPKELAELQESFRLYPDEWLAAQVEYPTAYIAKWDADTQQRRLTGIAANDCHHNMVFVMKMVDEQTVRVGTIVDRDDKMRTLTADLRPGIREMTKAHKPGDVLARLDLDPYYRSFLNLSTHIFAPELTEAAIRAALKAGHAYVSHDWMCDPTGFLFEARPPATQGQARAGAAHPSTAASIPLPSPALSIMGDEVKFAPGLKLAARAPIKCQLRLLKNGTRLATKETAQWEHAVDGPGVYRLEAWLTLADEERPWIYSNPIYVR